MARVVEAIYENGTLKLLETLDLPEHQRIRITIHEPIVESPDETLEVEGANPAEIAAEVANLRERLTGKPAHLLLASSDEPAFAMPAAGWAARSGDPVLYVKRRSVPEPTRKALRRLQSILEEDEDRGARATVAGR